MEDRQLIICYNIIVIINKNGNFKFDKFFESYRDKINFINMYSTYFNNMANNNIIIITIITIKKKANNYSIRSNFK